MTNGGASAYGTCMLNGLLVAVGSTVPTLPPVVPLFALIGRRFVAGLAEGAVTSGSSGRPAAPSASPAAT